MQIGLVGAGKMGSGVAARLTAAGHKVVAYDQDMEAVHKLSEIGVTAAGSLDELAQRLTTPRIIWLALPAGEITNGTVTYLEHLLAPGDVVCDAGNSPFSQSIEHSRRYASRDIHFIDVGISGGLAGREDGYCLMVGGSETAIQPLSALWDAVAQPHGMAHVGPAGAGHYVKMVHNGIEYGLLQATAEGMHILADGSFRDRLNLGQIAELWQHGSIIRGYIGELTSQVLQNPESVQSLDPVIDDTGEGAATVKEALDHKIPTPALAAAVMVRHQTAQKNSWAAKIIASLRQAFGGHPTHRS